MKGNIETLGANVNYESWGLQNTKEISLDSSYLLVLLLIAWGFCTLRSNKNFKKEYKEPELRELYSQLVLLVDDSETMEKINAKIKKLSLDLKIEFLVNEIVTARAKVNIDKKNKEREYRVDKFYGERID